MGLNLVNDIKKIVKNDREHNVKIEIDNMGVRVYLDYDPENIYEEKSIIPIEYTTLEQFAFIPDDEYRKRFNVGDYGIELNEIILIKNIMEYLEKHKDKINALCRGLAWEYRDNE